MKLPVLKKFKPGKTWIVLGVALGIGLLAALAARSYLSNRMEAIEARSKGKMVSVVVAKRDLSRGAKLTEDSVAVRSIPVDYAQSLAVTPDAFDRIDGQVLAYPVKSGEMILWGLMEGKKVPTFSTRVETGHRAMTVPVDEINSISGLLEPGDIVDLIATIDKKGKKVTFPLLQSVQVIATGQRSVDDPKSGQRREYSTVTFDITPEQAQNVIVARDAGKITALLRNPQDTQIYGKKWDVAALLGLKGAATDGGVDDRQVPVLYGGRGNKIPPEGLKLGQYVSTSGAGAAATNPLALEQGGGAQTPAVYPPVMNNSTPH